MKTIQNKALADTDLMLGKELVRGDSEGRFEVDDAMADMLTKTPGWKESETAPAKDPARDPVEKLRQATGRAPAAPTPAGSTKAAPAATRSPRAVRATAAVETAAPSPPPPPAAPSAPAAPAAAPTPPAEPEAASEPEQADAGPDITTLDAAGLIRVAEDYGIKLTKARREGPVEELRKYLDEQLYEPEPASPT